MRYTHLVAALVLAGTLLLHGETASDFLMQTANDEQSVPQGNDPPGPDEPGQPQPAPNDRGVIKPPPTGDEEIHTTFPNPDAGHDKEVIPPPGTPENQPNLDPR